MKGASGASGSGATSDGPQSDQGADPRAQVDDACEPEGTRTCADRGSRDVLVCERGKWQAGARCRETERCDSSNGEDRGKCVSLAPECMGQKQGQAFCDDDVRRVCPDLITSQELPCDTQQRCVMVDGRALCACVAGSIDRGFGCQPATDCAIEAGGCDELTECQMQAGQRVCTACPPGHSGDGLQGCAAQLLALDVSCGTLSPALAADVRQYRVRVPPLCQTLTLTAAVPDGATVDINGDEVATGASWTSRPLEAGDTQINIRLGSRSGVSSTYELVVERPGDQETYFKASNAQEGDGLGFSVAVSGDTLVAGAIWEDSNSGSDPGNNSAPNAGAVYVFGRDGDSWVEQAYLKSDAPAEDKFFGASVAIAGDLLVVGEPASSPLRFNTQITHGFGSAYVFERQNGSWVQVAKFTGTMDGELYGFSVATDGETVIVAAPYDTRTMFNSGSVHVVARQGGAWKIVQQLIPANMIEQTMFGFSVAVDGDTALIGAANDPTGAPLAGSAFVFTRDAEGWHERQRLAEPRPSQGATFGWSLALRGDRAVVGAAHVNLIGSSAPGSAYVFDRSRDGWIQTAQLTAAFPSSSDRFGVSVALTDTAVIVGASGDNSGARGAGGDPTRQDARLSGAVHIFAQQGNDWLPTAYLKAANTDADDAFGYAVASGGGTLVAGAPYEAGQSNGINVEDASNGAPDSGALYTFY